MPPTRKHKKKNERTGQTTPLKEAFLALLRQTKDNEAGYFRARAKMMWADTFGKHVAENTTKLLVRNRILYVYVSNAPLRAQMLAVREGIKTRLNEDLGEDYFKEVQIR